MYKYSVTLRSGAIIQIELMRPLMDLFNEAVKTEVTGNKDFYLDWLIVTQDDKGSGFRFSELAAFELISGPKEKPDV